MTPFNDLLHCCSCHGQTCFEEGQTLDIPKSMKLAMTPESRFFTAMSGMFATDSLAYVHGLVAVSWTSEPIEHGWLEFPSGRIVDPSPRYCEGQAGVLRYFPAQRWTREQLQRLMKKHRDGVQLPLFRRHVQCVDGRRVTVAADITDGWRRAIANCHDFRFAFHGEAGPYTEEIYQAEEAILEHELSAWPEPSSDEEEW